MEEPKESQIHVERLEEDDYTKPPVGLSDTALQAAQFQARAHSITRLQAIKENWRSLAWCMYMFFICISWGYDGLAGGVVVSIAEFRRDFGTPYKGEYTVDAGWQIGWLAATLGGMVIGGYLTGLVVDLDRPFGGRRKCIAVAFVVSAAGTVAQFLAKDPSHFFAGKLLTGIPMGVFTSVAPTYASEMAPLNIRGAMAAGMNFSIVLGQLIGYGVMREASYYQGNLQYKILFAAQWGFCVVGLVILPWFPESPYWLVAHGQVDEARNIIAKLHDEGSYDVDGHIAEIREALLLASSSSATDDTGDDAAAPAAQGGISECFSKDHWRRTLVATSVVFIQNASGNAWVIGYMSYFMQLAGMPATQAADTSVGLCGMMVVGNMSGWFLIEWLGRRGTALWGNAILCVALFLIGILAVIPVKNAIWGQVVFMAIWAFFYQATIGSVAWPIASENATSRLRSPTQSLATMMNGLSQCIWSFSLPYAINPDQGNLGGKIAFIFGGVLFCSWFFVFFFIPETKGRSYLEIDQLWSRRVNPRKFAETEVPGAGDGNGRNEDAVA